MGDGQEREVGGSLLFLQPHGQKDSTTELAVRKAKVLQYSSTVSTDGWRVEQSRSALLLLPIPLNVSPSPARTSSPSLLSSGPRPISD